MNTNSLCQHAETLRSWLNDSRGKPFFDELFADLKAVGVKILEENDLRDINRLQGKGQLLRQILGMSDTLKDYMERAGKK